MRASARDFCKPASAGAARASARTRPRWWRPPAEYGLEMPIVKAAREVNRRQRERVVEKLLGELKILKGRTIGLLGLAFKPNTDDLRDAPAIDIAKRLIERGARVKAHDPVAMERFRAGVSLVSKWSAAPPPRKSAEGADALVLVTEWPRVSRTGLGAAGEVHAHARLCWMAGKCWTAAVWRAPASATPVWPGKRCRIAWRG